MSPTCCQSSISRIEERRRVAGELKERVPLLHMALILLCRPDIPLRTRLSSLINAGVDILRLNMAHASHQWVDNAMWFVREASSEVGRHVAVMMDVKGPEIRTGKDEARVRCEVLTPGSLGSKRHINLPGVYVNLPSLTRKDEDDLRAGVKTGIDFVVLSFVRQAEDIRTLRRFLDELGSYLPDSFQRTA